ncbi:MAG: hypothetical protein IJ381_08305 [Clostridia bacterium]|nr:hypothetical protein [Clostridia bacterium]
MATIESVNAKGNAGIALGSTALGIEALSLLANGGLGNLLGNLTGGCRNTGCGDAAAMAAMMAAASAIPNHGCSEDHCVNRYEAAQSARIAELETEVKLRDANTFTMGEMNAMRNYVDNQFREIRDTLCGQAVMNQKTEDAFKMVQNDLICTKNELYTAIARERDERCCGDNAIVNYVNATFYPKMVADVTTGTETTAQSIYNPVPNCGRCGGCRG